MNSNKRTLAYLSLALASIIWGANGPIMKYVLQTIPPFSLAFIRFGTASLLLLPFVYKKLFIAKKDIPRVILCAIFGVSLNIGFFFLGLQRTSALNAGIIGAALPIITLIFARVFLKEKITRNFLLGAMLGLVGILVIVGKNFFGADVAFSPVGDIFILFAMLSYVGYEVISKNLRSYSALVITFYSFLIGSVSFLPFSIFEYQNNPQWIHSIPSGVIMGILYGIFFSSLTAYCLWQWALWQIDADRVGFFFYLDPIVSTVVAVLFLSEPITPPFIFGSILIFTGLFIAEGHIRHYHLLNLFLKPKKL